MAKHVRSSRRKSNGKRSPSYQELRQSISGVKGTTDNTKVGVSAVPTAKPGLRRRNPRIKSGRHSHLTDADIRQLPSDALVGLDGVNQAVIALYDTEFESVSEVVKAIRNRL